MIDNVIVVEPHSFWRSTLIFETEDDIHSLRETVSEAIPYKADIRIVPKEAQTEFYHVRWWFPFRRVITYTARLSAES